jgi:hypothetical protein
MAPKYRVTAPQSVLEATADVVRACKASADATLAECASFFDDITNSKTTISSGALDVLDRAEPRVADPVAHAACYLANLWLDLALQARLDITSIEATLKLIQKELRQRPARSPK